MQYFYMRKGEVEGPVGMDSIERAVADGRLEKGVMIRAETGGGEWTRYGGPEGANQGGQGSGAERGKSEVFGKDERRLEMGIFWMGRVLFLLVAVLGGTNVVLTFLSAGEWTDGVMVRLLGVVVMLVMSALLAAVGRALKYLRMTVEEVSR